MSRDRLAASRAQRQQQLASAQAHEMSTINTPSQVNGHDVGVVPAFLAEVTSIQDGIQRINANVAQISALHSRSVTALDDGKPHDTARLDELASETRMLSNELKERIKTLENATGGQDAQMRKNRTSLVRAKFLEAIQNYQQVEQEYRVKSRQRVERQLRIVKPDATPDEVAAAAEGGSNQIFADALTTSPRYGESRAAYREVQQRQQDIRKMEETLADLAQLFADMGTLVEQQEDTINEVESTAKDVEANTQKALEHTGTAVKHARSYRKGRWICFFIFLFVAAVLAIVLGVVFGRK